MAIATRHPVFRLGVVESLGTVHTFVLEGAADER
jgi:hypothetical protein